MAPSKLAGVDLKDIIADDTSSEFLKAVVTELLEYVQWNDTLQTCLFWATDTLSTVAHTSSDTSSRSQSAVVLYKILKYYRETLLPETTEKPTQQH